jgi:hypothetical protein
MFIAKCFRQRMPVYPNLGLHQHRGKSGFLHGFFLQATTETAWFVLDYGCS